MHSQSLAQNESRVNVSVRDNEQMVFSFLCDSDKVESWN